MKIVKITLAVLVTAAIAVALIWGFMSVSDSGEIQTAENQFTKKIKLKIDSLKIMPASSFCEKNYKEIKFYIEDDYSNNRLGSNRSDNDAMKKSLINQLYAAYTDKFFEQAFYIFNGSDWDEKKLKFVRAEYQALQKEGMEMGLLEESSTAYKTFNVIRNIFAKYDELNNFVATCHTYSNNISNNMLIEFPISDVDSLIKQSNLYLANDLENIFVKNCIPARRSLMSVPDDFLKAHNAFLENKIDAAKGMYTKCNNYTHWSNIVYDPLNEEITKISNPMYNLDDANAFEQELLRKSALEEVPAYRFFDYGKKKQ
jgi:hypothetical protein